MHDGIVIRWTSDEKHMDVDNDVSSDVGETLIALVSDVSLW
jgi:hypothetical protein